MKASQRTLGAAAGFSAAWFLMAVIPTPLLWYLPLSRRFEFATVVTELGMDFYGRLLLALVVAAGAAWVAPALRLKTLFVWALTLFALCTALEVTTLSRRHPVPLTPEVRGR